MGLGLALGGVALAIAPGLARGELEVKGEAVVNLPSQPRQIPPGEPVGVPTLTVEVMAITSGLRRRDFALRVASPTPVTYRATEVIPFRESERPLSMIILVDGKVRFLGDPSPAPLEPDEVPRAIPGAWPEVQAAIDVLAAVRHAKSKAGLWVYADTIVEKVPLGAPAAVRGDQLGARRDYASNATSSLRLALRRATNRLSREAGRRIIIVLGDGRDVTEDAKDTDVRRALQSAGVELHFLLASAQGVDPTTLAKLRRLAKRVGGSVHRAQPIEQLPQLAENLVRGFDNLYTVTFPAANPREGTMLPFDGTEHDLTIVARNLEGTVSVVLPVWAFPAVQSAPARRGLWLYFLTGGGALLAGALAWAVVRRRRSSEDEAPVLDPAWAPEVVTLAPRVTMMLAPVDDSPLVGWLVPLTGARRQETFRLRPDRTVIGTAPTCEVSLPDPYMSGSHAEIRAEGRGFCVYDCGSANGTFVNGQRTGRHELIDNDTIRCGATELRFKSTE